MNTMARDLAILVALFCVPSAACNYDPPPDVWLEAGENPNFLAGEPIVLKFSEPISRESLEIRVWSGKEAYYDIEAERDPLDVPILDLCTPDTSPCQREFDCNDEDGSVFPRANETCGSDTDLNCSGSIGEDGCMECMQYYRDVDGDAFGITGESRCLNGPDGEYRAIEAGDCNDADHAMNPGSFEVCQNGRDDDCDGLTDEETDTASCDGDEACVDLAESDGCRKCITFYLDADGDTFGDSDDSNCLNAPQGGYRAARIGDCDDGDPAVNPLAEEECNGIDDNCDGRIDEGGSLGCLPYFHDNDGDGAGAPGNLECLCAASLDFSAETGDDCDDGDYFMYPDADEVCDNDRDDDCDGDTDENECTECFVYFLDKDSDGFGVGADSRCLPKAFEAYTATEDGDCDDFDEEINPGVEGTCDTDGGACGEPDKGSCAEGKWFYFDKDGDGYGETRNRKCLCGQDGLYSVETGGDCNDSAPLIHPGADEACTSGSGDGIDENCDGATDEEDALGCTTWYLDNDGDTVGTQQSRCLCGPDGLYDTGDVRVTLDEKRTEVRIDVSEGALGPLRNPLVLEVTGNLADDKGNVLNVSRYFDFQIVGGGLDIETCGSETLPESLDVVEGPFLFFADFPSPPSPIPISQQFFSDIQVDKDTGKFVVLLTDADPKEGAPLNTKDPGELNLDTGEEGFIFTVRGCMATDKAKGLQFETFPFTLALTIGPIHFELRENILRGRIGPDPVTGLAKWDGTMFVQELYMKVGGDETFYPPAQANFQMLQLREGEIPDGMSMVCDTDPCEGVLGSCDILDPWPPPELCE